jgi:hypothetical protein
LRLIMFCFCDVKVQVQPARAHVVRLCLLFTRDRYLAL